MNEAVNIQEIEKYRKLGLIDEIALRNYFIKKEFKELRENGFKSREALMLLAQKYNLSESSINMVVYG